MRKSKYFREACSDHKNDPSKLCNTINENCCRKPKSSIITNLETGGKRLSDSADIATAFNEHFSRPLVVDLLIRLVLTTLT